MAEINSKKLNASDWEVVPENAVPENIVPAVSQSKLSQWTTLPEPTEPITESIMAAPSRIGEDIGRSILSGLERIPQLYEKAKTEIPGLPGTIAKHPLHAFTQLGAGAGEMYNKLFGLPRNLAEYASSRLHLLPEAVAKSIPAPQPFGKAQQELLGEPKYPGEEMLRGLTRDIPEIAATKGALSAVNPMRYTPKNIIKDIYKTKPRLEESFNKAYNSFYDKAEKAGVGGALKDIPAIDYETIYKWTPPKQIEGLKNFQSDPNISTARSALSDLKKVNRDLDKKTTFTEAEKAQSQAINKAILDITDNMLRNTEGKIDPKLMKEFKNLNKAYRDIYVPYKDPNISAYKAGDITNKQLLDALKVGPFGRRRANIHHLNTLSNLANVAKAIGIGGFGLGGLGAGIEGTKYLYRKLFGNEPEYEKYK